MKWLILSPLLLSWSLWAQTPELPGEIDADIDRKVVTVVKGLEVERLLVNSAEFIQCRDQNKDDPAKMEECFRKKLRDKKEPELKALSERLGLQSYGLVKSQNAKDITEYLTRNLRKALTGEDPDDPEYQRRKFSQRKLVDQKAFLDIYKSQLGKNALFEVSRFCLENFRKEGRESETSLAAAWPEYFGDGAPASPASSYVDTGKGSEFKYSNATDKNQVYQDLFRNLTGDGAAPLKAEGLRRYFEVCSHSITMLCQRYKDAQGDVGREACLTEGRLQEIRRGITKTALVGDEFNKMKGSAVGLQLEDGADFHSFSGPNSIDSLTNYASTNFIKEGDQGDRLARECAERAENPECEKFFSTGNDLVKASETADQEMRLHKQIEIHRALRNKEMGAESFDKYLRDNGLIQLAEKYKGNPQMSEAEVEAELGKAFDARRSATLASLRERVGSRQQPQGEMTEKDVQEKRKTAAKESLEERSRMAQVVMFNNIITSQLKLRVGSESSGREVSNVGAWKKEEEGLKGKSINMDFFQNLQRLPQEDQYDSQGGEFSAVGFIDQVLGKAPTAEP